MSSKTQRGRIVKYQVSGCNHIGKFLARNVAAAVKKFRKTFHVGRCWATHSERDGTYSGLHIDIVK